MIHAGKLRSVMKTITWRIIATIITIILVLIFTGDLAIASTVGGIEIITKMILYYIHERTWSIVPWGYEK